MADSTPSTEGVTQMEIRGHAALLRLCGNFFANVRHLDSRDEILNALEYLNRNVAIKVIIISSAFCGAGVEEYIRFFREQQGTMEKQRAHRFCNAINQVTLEIVRSGKLVVHVCGGEMVAFFLGMSLAADYAVVEEGSVFHNSYLDVGVLPKGGLPYFIARRGGCRSVYNLLLGEREIDAGQALQLGLVDALAPAGKAEEAAFAYAARFAEVPARTITGMKRLTNWCIRDLEEYLSYENKQILKTLDMAD